MKVVALVSGGKDSCYNILKCQEHGHEVVALANLHPEANGADELDSYCFQTVGHNILHLYPQCMGIPMYRRKFLGVSHQRGLGYTVTEGDEVEEMFTLLAFVCSKHRDVGGVSSGAIASDYQRVRVENVCARLGLVSLAFMWHQPQAKLLRGMVDAGLHSIIIKVACLGLTAKHLGSSIAELEPVMLSLADKYGCNVCGEGGEFETLTLDGPMFPLGRIEITEHAIDVADSNPIAPVASLRPLRFQFVPKPQPAATPNCTSHLATHTYDQSVSSKSVEDVPEDWVAPTPQQVDQSKRLEAAPPPPAHACAARICGKPADGYFSLQTFGGEVAAVESYVSGFTTRAQKSTEPQIHDQHASSAAELAWQLSHVVVGGDGVVARSGSMGAGMGNAKHGCSSGHELRICDFETSEATGAAVAACLDIVERELAAQSTSWGDVIYVHLFLRNMKHFASANHAYMAAVPQTSAPSRACVATPFPPGVLCSLDISVAKTPVATAASAHTHASSAMPTPLQTDATAVENTAEGGCVGVANTGNGGVVGEEEKILEGCGSRMRKVMHVQSHSEWAPASIGPYSQATVWGGLLHIAGQIPLHPASMQVTAADDVTRCMRSCSAVASALGCHLPTSLLSLVTFHTPSIDHTSLVKSTNCMHASFSWEEAEKACSEGGVLSGDTAGVFSGEEIGDSYRIVRATEGCWTPLRLFVAVPALPKACAVELQPLCAVATSDAARQSAVLDSDSDDDSQDPSWMGRLQCSQSTCHPGSHAVSAESAPVELHMHTVYSTDVLLLSQIVCADVRCIEHMHAPHASQSEEGSAAVNAAVAALDDVWALLQQQKKEAGLAACTAWSCRLFVVPEVAKRLHACMNAPLSSSADSSEFGASNSRVDRGGGAAVIASGTQADSAAESQGTSVREGLDGAIVNEVEGLHDGEREVAWALRVVVAQ